MYDVILGADCDWECLRDLYEWIEKDRFHASVALVLSLFEGGKLAGVRSTY